MNNAVAGEINRMPIIISQGQSMAMMMKTYRSLDIDLIMILLWFKSAVSLHSKSAIRQRLEVATFQDHFSLRLHSLVLYA